MPDLTGISKTFETWGIPVAPSERVPGRPGPFSPTHVMVHHTASRNTGPNPSAETVRVGRLPELPGPLCHILVRRDMRVELVSIGRANHAGAGTWPGVGTAGNTKCIGIEIEHAGTSAEPWSAAYRLFCRRVHTAVLAHLEVPASHLLAHKEWAPSRKIDPYNWDMADERRLTAAMLAAGPPKESSPAVADPFKTKHVLTKWDVATYGEPTVKVGTEKSWGELLRNPPAVARLRREAIAQHGAVMATLKTLLKAVNSDDELSADEIMSAAEAGAAKALADHAARLHVEDSVE